VYNDRRRWAFCFRVDCLTLGISSTQRVEGLFSKLKRLLKKLGTLTELEETVRGLVAKEVVEAAKAASAAQRKKPAANEAGHHNVSQISY
jgi:hypothetical protein